MHHHRSQNGTIYWRGHLCISPLPRPGCLVGWEEKLFAPTANIGPCVAIFCTRPIVVIVSVSRSISHFVVIVGWGVVTITWCSIESYVAVLSWHRINGCPIGGSTTFIFLDFRCISFYLHAVSPFPLMRKSTHPPTIESIISLFLDYTQSSYKLNYVLLVCCCCFCFDDPASTYIDAEEIRPQWRIEGIFMFR